MSSCPGEEFTWAFSIHLYGELILKGELGTMAYTRTYALGWDVKMALQKLQKGGIPVFPETPAVGVIYKGFCVNLVSNT
jgi:hypothetical protein